MGQIIICHTVFIQYAVFTFLNILIYPSDQETEYGRFLAGLSAHLTLSVPEKLCNYFKFTNEKKEEITSSQTPGQSFLLTLEEMGVIGPSDVSSLETPLQENHLLQAVAKIHDYQSLDSTPHTDLPDEGDETCYILCCTC